MKQICVCRLCGKKIDSGWIEIVPERAMIVRHKTQGEQIEFDREMYGIDPDKYVKKRDVIKLLIRSTMCNKKALIESIKEL